MADKHHLQPADLVGLARLGVRATGGLTDLVEALHHNIAQGARPLGEAPAGRPGGITGLVYRSIRGVTTLVGGTLEVLLGQIATLLGERPSSVEREAVLAALNGVLGDHLAATNNPLAIPMRLRRNGTSLALTREALAAELGPLPGGSLMLVIHGLCMNDLQWGEDGDSENSPIATLARQLGRTPLFLHYNSGRHVSENGRDLAALLEELLRCWPQPVDDLAIVGHSMGGLIARSAVHQATAAGQSWPGLLRQIVFLGTPHHAAPLERSGNWVDTLLALSPYSAPIARLGKIRSASITDLRYGNLLEEDWQGRDRFEKRPDGRKPVPLPAGVAAFAVAGSQGHEEGDLGDELLGDGLVLPSSALGDHPDPALDLHLPAERRRLFFELGHLALLRHPEVLAQVESWLREPD